MGWEEFSQKISKTGKEMSEKVKETSDVLRLKQKIYAEETELKETFGEIGKKYFEEHEGIVDSEMIPLFEKVSALQASIEKYQAEINSIKKAKNCPVCGSVMSMTDVFCSRCGSKLD